MLPYSAGDLELFPLNELFGFLGVTIEIQKLFVLCFPVFHLYRCFVSVLRLISINQYLYRLSWWLLELRWHQYMSTIYIYILNHFYVFRPFYVIRKNVSGLKRWYTKSGWKPVWGVTHGLALGPADTVGTVVMPPAALAPVLLPAAAGPGLTRGMFGVSLSNLLKSQTIGRVGMYKIRLILKEMPHSRYPVFHHDGVCYLLRSWDMVINQILFSTLSPPALWSYYRLLSCLSYLFFFFNVHHIGLPLVGGTAALPVGVTGAGAGL